MGVLAETVGTIGRRLKHAATEKLVLRAAKAYANADDETLKKVWKLMERVASTPGTKWEARRMRYMLDIGHPGAEWLKKIARDLHPNCARKFISNLYGTAWFLASGKREEFKRKHGFLPPWLLVFDMTMRCNLKCEGCWAGSYKAGERPELPYEVLQRMIDEAREEMGVHFFTVTGGEPFVRKDSWRLYEENEDCMFMIYTNATLIDDEAADRLQRLGNCMLMMSIEGTKESTDTRRGQGTYDKIMAAMDRLKERGILFGFSATPMRDNWQAIMTDEFVSKMTEKGCAYGWFFQYVPVGRDANPDLMVPPEAREELRRRLYRFREKYPIYMVDFWNDGPETGGCLAGGRYYLHVSANGDIEPCVFAHLATHNIKTSTLTEALKAPLFSMIREEVPYEGNLLRPCMIIDRPDVLRRVWREAGARPTHPGADNVLQADVAAKLDRYSSRMRAIYDPVWAAGEDIRKVWPEPPANYR